MDNWTFCDRDREIADALRQRLPERMFDAHAHLLPPRLPGESRSGLWAEGPEELSPRVWRERIGRLIGPERLHGGLLIPAPNHTMTPEDIVRANEHTFVGIAAATCLRGLALVAPAMRPEQYEPWLGKPQFAGFKPYHVFSSHHPTFQAPLSTYLPEWAWRLADRRGLIITLHMVRDRALSDPDNLREIRHYCEKYPRAKLVLAHAARGFHAPNTVEGIDAIADLRNVWFDSSAICEAEPLTAILETFGPSRLMWGTDFPVSEIRGRCVTVGDGFAWLQPDSVRWDKTGPQGRPTLVGLESLRALLSATERLGLSRDDLQDLCADNARRLLGILAEPGNRTRERYRQARRRIPGGTQLLSKRPEMMAPDVWPAYFREARGCLTQDLDGRWYRDFSTNGIGSCLLGFRDPDVTRAVRRRLELGSMSSLNPPEEVELAELLCEIHPWAEQARFARGGGEACAMAVRIARATTRRDLVAVCGYHGWQDWYLAANLGDREALDGHLLPGLDPTGVPRGLGGTTRTFAQNDRAALQKILSQQGHRLAAIIMEPCRSEDPEPGFLEYALAEAHKAGALLIFDEITIGWRLHYGGAHLKFGVAPDLAVFAKALGNGHPMAAVLGTREAMEGAHRSFISSTYWTESIGPAAALATLRKMRQADVPDHVARIGRLAMDAWKDTARRHRLPVSVHGYPCLCHFRFDHPQATVLRTLFTHEMLVRGFLAGTGFYPTLAHTEAVVQHYVQALDEVFGSLAEALASDQELTRLLPDPAMVAHNGFQRLIK